MYIYICIYIAYLYKINCTGFPHMRQIVYKVEPKGIKNKLFLSILSIPKKIISYRSPCLGNIIHLD